MNETLPVSRKKRGLKFWLVAALCVVVLTPVLAFAVAWGYVKLGYLKSSVETNLSKKFGAPARVGEVKSGVLGGMEMGDVSIEARDKSAPITLDSAKVEWNLKALLSDGRLRSVSLERPRVDLRYSPNSGWNHSVNFSNEGAAIQIGRFEFRNGSFALGLPSGGVKLENVSGNFTNFEGRGASPFVLRGELNGHDALVLEGSGGPAQGDFSVHGRANLLLEKDVGAFISGMKGSARVELSARREMHGGGDLLGLNAAVSVKDFSWAHLNLAAEKFSVEANAKMTMSDIEFDNLKIGSEKHGTFVTHGAHQVGPRGYLRLDDTSWALEFEELDRAFSPRLLEGIGELRGRVTMSGASLMLPLAERAPAFSLKGVLKSPRLIWTVPGFGDLPEAEVEAAVDWPVLQRGEVKLGDFASTEISMADMSGKEPVGMNFKKLNFDLGRFYESALGRRVILGAANAFVRDLPYALGGTIGGDALESKWMGNTYSISKLEARELEVVKWPLEMRVPGWKFSGPMKTELKYADGNLSGLTLGAELKARDGKIEVAVKSKTPRSAKGWGAGSVEIEKFKAPLNELDKAFAWLAGTGMQLSGELEGEGIRIDPGTGSAGRLHLGGAGIGVAMTEKLRAFGMGMARFFGKDPDVLPFSAVKLLDAVNLKDLNADISFRQTEKKFSISGRTQPATISISLPVLPDFSPPKIPQVPALSFQINTSEVANGVRHEGWIEWPGGRLSCDAIQAEDGQWTYKGALTGKPGGFEARYERTFDEAEKSLGPIKITIPVLELSDLVPANEKEKKRWWSGAIKGLKVEISPLSFGADGVAYKTRIDGEFVNATVLFAGYEFEKVNGTFTVRVGAGADGNSVDFQSTLASVSANLWNGSLRLQPPAGGRSTAIKLAFATPRAGAAVRLDKFEIDAGEYFRFSTRGLMRGDGGGHWLSVELKDVLLHAADLKVIGQGIVTRPELAGRALFLGSAGWDQTGQYSVDGTLKLEHVAVRTSGAEAIEIKEMNGEVPVSLPEKKEPLPGWRELLMKLNGKVGAP